MNCKYCERPISVTRERAGYTYCDLCASKLALVRKFCKVAAELRRKLNYQPKEDKPWTVEKGQ